MNQARSIPQYLGVLFYDLSIRFPLDIDHLYPVLGMELYRYQSLGKLLYHDILQVLVPDNSADRHPQWMPVELFEIEPSEVPSNWYFRRPQGTAAASRYGFRARWGYRELVESDEHRDSLVELDPAALAVFAEELARAGKLAKSSRGLM